MNINDIDQSKVEPKISTPINNMSGDLVGDVENQVDIDSIASVLGMEKVVSKDKDNLDILLRYAKTQVENDSPDEIKWVIRELDNKIGSPPFLEEKLPYLARYAYLLLETKKLNEERQKFERRGL